jgi:hypothetical protein
MSLRVNHACQLKPGPEPLKERIPLTRGVSAVQQFKPQDAVCVVSRPTTCSDIASASGRSCGGTCPREWVTR